MFLFITYYIFQLEGVGRNENIYYIKKNLYIYIYISLENLQQQYQYQEASSSKDCLRPILFSSSLYTFLIFFGWKNCDLETDDSLDLCSCVLKNEIKKYLFENLFEESKMRCS